MDHTTSWIITWQANASPATLGYGETSSHAHVIYFIFCIGPGVGVGAGVRVDQEPGVGVGVGTAPPRLRTPGFINARFMR